MSVRLKERRAIVTGGARGIGQAIAERLAREGAWVAVADCDAEAAQHAAAAIANAGGRAEAVVVDVTQADEVQAMVEHVQARWGAIDILVANAGTARPTPFLEIQEADWDRHLAVNLKGVFLCGQAVARAMVAAGRRGRIINMSSVNGMMGEANLAHYNASKGGVSLLTMSMAIDLAPYGITVNALAPGFIHTRLTDPVISQPDAIRDYLRSVPLRRYGTPEDVAGAAAFLASDDAAYITGHLLVVDGGQAINLAPLGRAGA